MIRIITSSRYPVQRKVLLKWVESLYAKYSLALDSSLHIIFVGKKKMKTIATTYKHEPVALPVLAFPYANDASVGEKLLGEIMMCYPQIILLAAERNKRLTPLICELIEHGLKNILQ